MDDNLLLIKNILDGINKNNLEHDDYYIPGLWKSGESGGKKLKVNQYKFYSEIIKGILERKFINTNYALNQEDRIVFNMFVRHTTAYDHNNDGKISINPLKSGFRETGTFLKAIGMLPYLKNMGINTIYLLPITLIGTDGRKGSLGSPYAIKNPYKIDPLLSEPCLELDIETEFKAFMDAAHLIEMKVILEFVFRTSSIDCEQAIETPRWFYWIKENIAAREYGSSDLTKYGSPIFAASQIDEIKQKVISGKLKNLPKPNDTYLEMFTQVPKKVIIENGKLIGLLPGNKRCKIAGAFADWPPDDTQPAWDDVTYLRLFDHPNFNYIAYNTVRMYDEKLSDEDNILIGLWEHITGIIPYYMKQFAIDGVMIDMGHALPSELRAEIVKSAKAINKNFIFWEENFNPTLKSKGDGYDAAVGYLLFDEHKADKLKAFIHDISQKDSPLPYFATPENHNTPRAAARININYSKLAWLFNCFLTGLPFIHAGFELGETHPVNTGLDFSPDDIRRYPADKLPLFSEAMLCWDNPAQFTDHIKKVLKLRKKYLTGIDTFSNATFKEIKCSNPNVVGFMRILADGSGLVLLGNLHPDNELYFHAEIEGTQGFIIVPEKNKSYPLTKGGLVLSLKPMEYILGIIFDSRAYIEMSKIED